jgi:TorA maturation chaperone TorD
MTTATASGVAVAARWRLLSLGFTAPDEEIVREVETLAESLGELGEAPPLLEELAEALRATSTDDLAARYQALFGGPVRVSPYEGGYELDPIRQGREMADVSAFYRAFGADAAGPAGERPDHVGCELEFLAYLELRSLLAAHEGDETSAAFVDDIVSTFLRDHAGRWLPAFFAEVHDAAEDLVYRYLAELGAQAVRDELERHGVECAPVRRRALPDAVERDRFDCG